MYLMNLIWKKIFIDFSLGNIAIFLLSTVGFILGFYLLIKLFQGYGCKTANIARLSSVIILKLIIPAKADLVERLALSLMTLLVFLGSFVLLMALIYYD